MPKKQTKVSKNLSGAQKVGIGVALTTAAVAAAGSYFLYGSKKAAQNRKKVKSWMLKAKAEVLEGLEKAEHITAEEYNALVEVVGGAYSKVQDATRGEIQDFKKEMKEHWHNIEKSGAATKVVSAAKKMMRSAKPAKKNAKKVAKKATKRAATKKAK
ncbi:hypothetical protein KC727_02295 [Candidatus Kaiserbacteria bacterium]|nr:hypothetical protein [Candidatus Kaiserbacteria bacterium]